MRSPPCLSEVTGIAVMRGNGMGDYLQCEPALAALRAAAPQAWITLLAGAWGASALPGRPGPVDEVVLLPAIDGILPHDDEPLALREGFVERLRVRQFDLALQLHGGGRNSNPVVSDLGARFTAGLRAADAPALDLSITYQYWQHEVFRHLEVVEALGAPAVRVHPRLQVTAADRAAASALLGTADRPLALIHPGATDPRRWWPAARFGGVADALTRAGADVAVIGAGPDVAVVQQVVAAAESAEALTDLSFAQLVGVVDRAVLLVGNDSGPCHLAEAVGTATVGIYWCGNMIGAAPVRRDRHRVHTSWTLACPVCGVPGVGEPFPAECSDTVSWVADVPTHAVADSAVSLFETRRRCGGDSDWGW